MKISIITACFNNQDTIKDTIESVLNQTYQHIEYIIIDGLSSDHTLKIIEQYQDQRIKVFSEKDLGIYDALNKGIQKATGDYVGFLHADDVYAHKRVIEDVVARFKETNTDSLYGDLVYVDRCDIFKIKRYWQAGCFQRNLFSQGWMPPHPTFFVKRECYQQYGVFNLQYHIAADYELMLRFLLKYRISVVYLPIVMIKMRLGGASNIHLKNMIQKSREDLHIMQSYQIKFSWVVLIRKNMSKLMQFFKKPCLKENRL